MILFMKSVLLFVVIAGLCLCTVQAATPAPTSGALKTVRVVSAPAGVLTTLPTVAGLSVDTTVRAVSKTPTQTTRLAPSPTARATTPRPSATAAPSAKATTPVSPATAARTFATAEPNLTAPATDSPATLWPNPTTEAYISPTEYRTPDIDPGMTPYSGPTELMTAEPTPSWEVPANVSNATPTDPRTAAPSFTAEVVSSLPFELPPGAFGVERTPTPTETAVPFPSAAPPDAAGSSVLPRWLSYLLFVFLGISGVAGVAIVGSHIGSRRPGAPSGAAPGHGPAVRLLHPGAPEPTLEQQILIDWCAGFDPQLMHVEQLGRNLLRLEHSVQEGAKDRSLRLGRLVVFNAIPSTPVPEAATAWAGGHGFRTLAVDGSGMALVMPALLRGDRSILGILPVAEMIEGASPVPRPVLLTESERGLPASPTSETGADVPGAGNTADGA